MREITDKLNFIKTKSFCSLKDIVKGTKGHVTEQQEIFKIIYLIKDFIFRI